MYGTSTTRSGRLAVARMSSKILNPSPLRPRTVDSTTCRLSMKNPLMGSEIDSLRTARLAFVASQLRILRERSQSPVPPPAA